MRQDVLTTARRGGVLRRGVGFLSALSLAVVLAGCGTVNERMSEALGNAPAIGLPSGAPERPAVADRPAFPAVHDMPPQRASTVLTSEEQRQMQRELVAARDGQRTAPAAEAPEPPEAPALAPVARNRKPVIQPKPAAPRGSAPAPSAQTIY
jgi:hypothetical protein